MNAELQRLYDEDQADRTWTVRNGGDWEAVAERDRVRRRHVAEMLAAGEIQDGLDYCRAALIFHHSDRLDDLWRAYELALTAAEQGYWLGRRMAAYAYDRWLVQQGKAQKYGTQWTVEHGCWRLIDTDPATTDAERRAWDVPSTAEQEQMFRDYYGEGPTHADPSPHHHA